MNVLKAVESRLSESPYEDSIKLLQTLSDKLGPLEKARCIVEMSGTIVKSIN